LARQYIRQKKTFIGLSLLLLEASTTVGCLVGAFKSCSHIETISFLTGIDLENIVYYKDNTHYFVMTAKKQSLLDKGVVINVSRTHYI